ncbi:hypothetical protein ACRE_074190 [Hapsidospora chrysogenum ATCC 11550]|uniref:Uncharacterized protein n=1 Tax=Hapsidospora chrysogenum (strain ATCC 11550 / CBS 779.69 / DSM 880 / IAM 14645 / JCM 23072 / IMI 49137) TaxID=857340 RepID=A0A086SXL2_HAPC1|nr:hypothetical protein ACRE_074190 [Hapsidospora chrysogenum ATCC 11550]
MKGTQWGGDIGEADSLVRARQPHSQDQGIYGRHLQQARRPPTRPSVREQQDERNAAERLSPTGSGRPGVFTFVNKNREVGGLSHVGPLMHPSSISPTREID